MGKEKKRNAKKKREYFVGYYQKLRTQNIQKAKQIKKEFHILKFGW
uniref:Uncharacterized protein n=1 Tax=Rhizophora mucronata TaxID=61149 RepID=A0A2P2M758_RHIMU